MTKKQGQKIRAVIRKDCKLQGEYYRDGATCVLGGLGLAAGMKPRE